jgi:uncharacterized membrane protein
VCTAWAAGVAAYLAGRGSERVHPSQSTAAVAAVWTGRVLLALGIVLTAVALGGQVFDLTLDRRDVLAGDEGSYYLAAGSLITLAGLLSLAALMLPLRWVDLGGRASSTAAPASAHA